MMSSAYAEERASIIHLRQHGVDVILLLQKEKKTATLTKKRNGVIVYKRDLKIAEDYLARHEIYKFLNKKIKKPSKKPDCQDRYFIQFVDRYRSEQVSDCLEEDRKILGELYFRINRILYKK